MMNVMRVLGEHSSTKHPMRSQETLSAKMVKFFRNFKAPPLTKVFLKKVCSQREKTISFCYDMQAHLGKRHRSNDCKTSMP